MINVKIVEKKHESLHIAKKINEHQIVFIVDYIKPRVIKIGYALRKKGYKVVLLLNEKQKNMLSKDIPFYHQVIFFHAEKKNVYDGDRLYITFSVKQIFLTGRFI